MWSYIISLWIVCGLWAAIVDITKANEEGMFDDVWEEGGFGLDENYKAPVMAAAKTMHVVWCVVLGPIAAYITIKEGERY